MLASFEGFKQRRVVVQTQALHRSDCLSAAFAACGLVFYAETPFFATLCEVARPHKATLDKNFVHKGGGT